MVLANPAFADEEQTEEIMDSEIEVVYNDDGYVFYFEPQTGEFYFPSLQDSALDDSDIINTFFSERKLFMPYNTYEL